MSNQTANTQTTNLLPVQGTFEPLPPYECINLIGPAGTPFFAPVNPNLDGVNITNSTINSTTIGQTTPAAAQFTTASQQNQPVGNNDLTTKLYVDSLALGISWKQPVTAATTANITLSGAPKTVDSVTVQAGERVLVKDQSAPAENGIYVAASGPWQRSADANTWDEMVSALVFVTEGGLSGSAWYCPIQPGGTLGVTAITWNNFSVGGVYFAGTGLSLTGGDTFNIANTGVSAATYGGAAKAVTLAINAQGQITSASDTNIAINANQITSGTIDTARISGTYSGITGVGTLANLTVTNTISGSISGNAATATSATSATTATNLAGGALGSLPYQSATGTTAMLTAGTNGQFLTLSSGIPAWTNAPSASLTISADTANATRYPVFNDAATGSASTLYTTSAKYTFNPSTGTLTTSAHYLDYLDFNTGATVTPAVGRMWWGTTGTANFRLDSGAGYDTQINEQIFVYGKASSAITKGNLVIKTGVVGSSGVITFAPSTTGITDGNAFVGVAYEDIALNGFGRVVAVGLVRGLNTSAYLNNDTLWYDPAGGGAMSATKPSAPNVKAEIGIVINSGSGSSGSIYVKIFPGSQLGGTDQNVQLTTPISNNSLLQYDSTLTYWKNVAASSVSVGTATNLAGGAAGSLPYQSGAGATTFLAAGSDGQVLKLASGVPTWSSDTSGVTITDDTTTNATRYITFSNLTTGNETTLDVSSTKLTFNPSTGILTATGFSGPLNGTVGATTPATGAFTTVNGMTITSSTGTFNLTNGKTFAVQNTLTLAGTDSTTMTFPSTSQTIAGLGLAQTFTAAQTFRAANAIRSEAASTQDAIVIAGRAGGTSSRAITLTPASLGASRTATLPDPGADYTVGFRNIPQSGSDKTSSYTLTVDDIGEFVGIGSGGSITVPNNTFAAGDAISLFNNTTGNITITCSITTAYIAGANTDKDTMTLATRGVATILFISGTVCVVTGNVS